MREYCCDVVIFGGGVAGLWLLDLLSRDGYSALLLEARALGSGQTVASQGIIHGGLKYTLDGLFNSSAAAVRDMPDLWRACLAGRAAPDLSNTRIRADFCHLWRTGSIMSRVGMAGARAALRVAPVLLARDDYPAALRNCRGDVYRLDEQVVDPASLVRSLASLRAETILRYELNSLAVERHGPGEVTGLSIRAGGGGDKLRVVPRAVVLSAGEGNAALQQACGIDEPAMQTRPLHMVMARGGLPELNGHCTDGAKTRVTVTTDRDSRGRTVWQIGGQVAEDGVAMDTVELIRHTRRELADALPDLDVAGIEWATYRVNRAEQAMRGGARPSGAIAVRSGNVITAWPTKLALAPDMARRAAQCVHEMVASKSDGAGATPGDWPRPDVAPPPWEQNIEWRRAD